MGIWLKIIFGAPIVLVLAVLGCRAWRQARGAKALAIRTPNGIDEAGFVPIGGIDQWVSIRGEDLANPVIVVAHGGPGSGLSPLIAETTTTTWSPRERYAATRLATFLMRSVLPTDVPPYF